MTGENSCCVCKLTLLRLWRRLHCPIWLRLVFYGHSWVACTWIHTQNHQNPPLFFEKSVLIWHNLGVMWRERPIIWPLSLSVALSLSVQEGVLTNSRLWDSLRGLEGKWWPSDVLETYKCTWAWMTLGTRTSISRPVLHFDSPGRGGARGWWGLLGVQIHQTGWERAAVP